MDKKRIDITTVIISGLALILSFYTFYISTWQESHSLKVSSDYHFTLDTAAKKYVNVTVDLFFQNDGNRTEVVFNSYFEMYSGKIRIYSAPNSKGGFTVPKADGVYEPDLLFNYNSSSSRTPIGKESIVYFVCTVSGKDSVETKKIPVFKIVKSLKMNNISHQPDTLLNVVGLPDRKNISLLKY